MVIGCLALAPGAQAANSNAATTLTYLRADEVLMHQVKVHLPAAQVAVTGFVAQVTAECPGVAAQAPAGKMLEGLGEESLYAIGTVFEHTNAKATIAFARDIEHLHWSNQKLTGLVHLFAAAERAEAAADTPHLCSDLKEWVADGYSTLPQSTTQALKASSATIAPEEEILTLLTPYARSHTSALLHSVKSLEAQTELAVVKAVVPATVRLQEGLGMRRGTNPS